MVTRDAAPGTDTPAASRAAGVRRAPLITLLLSSLATMTGSTVTMAAVPLAVLTLSSSSLALGAVGAAETAAAAIGLVLAGPLADRVGPRRLAAWSALTAAVVLTAIPLADAVGQLHVWVLACAGAATALAAAPALVCRQLLIPPAARAAGADEARVQSLYWLFPRLGIVIGAPAAAVLVTTAGPVAAIWADIGSYLVSALLVTGFLPAPGHRAEETSAHGYLGQLREGIRAMTANRVIRSMAILAFVLSVLDAPRIPVIAPLYLRHSGAPGSALAWVVAAYTAGSLAGLLLYALLLARRPALPVVAGCLLGTAASYAALAGAHGAGAALLCMTVMGFAQGPFLPVMVSVLTAHTDPAVRGRVLSTLLAVVSAALPLGDLLFGSLVSALPLPAVLLTTAAVYAGAVWPTARVLGR
jgi:MFS family permease